VDAAVAARRPRPEQLWLSHLPRGAEQLAAVCAGRPRDPIARAFCGGASPRLERLADLYRLLAIDRADHHEIGGAQGNRKVALTASSSSVVTRSVSAVNPRIVVFSYPFVGPAEGRDEAVAAAFVRGEPFVELAGYDAATKTLNFYLLTYERAAATARCPTEGCYLPEVETGWTGWTLYRDSDLEDTPFDCLSCHRPGGPSGRKVFRMQELEEPWTHWFPFSEASGVTVSCAGKGETPFPAEADALWAAFSAAHEGEEAYGGIPLAEIRTSAAGHNLELFVKSHALAAFGSHEGGAQPSPFDSRLVREEAICTSKSATFASYQREVVAGRRAPLPAIDPDPSDPAKRARAIASYRAARAATEARPSLGAELEDLLSSDARRQMSHVPDEASGGAAILTQMCGRCHGEAVDPKLRRARFSVARLDRLSAAEKDALLDRLRLPRDAPGLMPPRRFGELPPWALARVVEVLGR
jgi:cytochrome c553